MMTRLFHCFEAHPEPNAQRLARRQAAQATWGALYQQGVVPCRYDPYVRDSSIVGDPRRLPFLKDVLQLGVGQAQDTDIVFWTNDDNHLHPALAPLLRMFCAVQGVGTSHRLDFREHKLPETGLTPEEIARSAGGLAHMGRDLVAATGRWWRSHWNQVPDVILGAPVFDLHLAAWVRQGKGLASTTANFVQVLAGCELPKGYVWHEQHQAVWTTLPDGNPAAAHNYRLFRQWGEIYMPSLRFGATGLI